MNDVDPAGAPYGTSYTSGTGDQPVTGSAEAPVWPEPPQGPSRKQGFFSRKRNIAVTAGMAVVAVAGVTIGLVSTSGSPSSSTTASSSGGGTASNGPRGPFAAGAGQGSNARAVNEPGGTSGTVGGVSGSGFTVTTTVGEQITVDESSSTTYQNASNGTSAPAAASVVTTGEGVLVLGTVNGATISATQVTVEPAGSAYTTASSDVTGMQQGQKNTSQAYGTIPSDYVEGQGTIVGAGTSDEAVASALQQYPGGIVDRVVLLADGDYEVHDIGTNIHHIFENSSFQVIGAN